MKFSVLETLAEGSGGSTPRCGDKVVVHYTGRLAGGKVFDCSRDRGFAMTFPVGVGKVIEGWDDAVATMSKGQRMNELKQVRDKMRKYDSLNKQAIDQYVVFSETYLVRYPSNVHLFQCLNSFAISKTTVRSASVLLMR